MRIDGRIVGRGAAPFELRVKRRVDGVWARWSIDANEMIGRGPRTSFCSRLFNFFLPDAPAANAARTLDWTCAINDDASMA